MSILTVVSQALVAALGLAVLTLSAWGIVEPARLMTLVTSVLDRKWGMPFGVIVRLVLGAALIISAPNSLFPLVFQTLGWIAIVAGLALVLMGRRNVGRLIGWFGQQSRSMVRLWLLFGTVFGGFLVYGSSLTVPL